MKQFLKNFSYSFACNLVALLVNAGITFVVPRYIGVEQYSYYQLFYFYTGYVGYLQFGWADGIYLRMGGMYYNEIDKEQLKSELSLYAIYSLLISVIVIIASILLINNPDKRAIIIMVGISVVSILPVTVIQYILQATNRIKEYATVIILKSLIFFLIILGLLIMGIYNYRAFCIGFLSSQVVSVCYAIYSCRDIWVARAKAYKEVLAQIKQDFSHGIKLTIAMISSVLIIGIVRFAIELQWSVVLFGKISLTLSISNLLMLFVRAISMIMFPVLRRVSKERLNSIYMQLRNALMIPLFGMLLFYYPIKVIMIMWLPQYKEGLQYMAILFPLCIFESKMSMLIETYLKTLHKETWLLEVNICTVVLSIITSAITIFVMKSLTMAILSILVLIAFRCILAETLLQKVLKEKITREIPIEIGMTALFVLFNWCIGGIQGMILYSLFYVIYLIFKRKDIYVIVEIFKNHYKVNKTEAK